ncbi:Hypothetical predicted protein [Marmota monax]|uniref:Uncharacterized protein n=1 Tax=Marmota monax TaxID=9995 RepID=A0A5E4AFA2_MARMO|nr:hypothetical protein GHT09_000813 [Marmota monax]VTJ56063.1 Hypothetical predicted protein [Marmota monax]
MDLNYLCRAPQEPQEEGNATPLTGDKLIFRVVTHRAGGNQLKPTWLGSKLTVPPRSQVTKGIYFPWLLLFNPHNHCCGLSVSSFFMCWKLNPQSHMRMVLREWKINQTLVFKGGDLRR